MKSHYRLLMLLLVLVFGVALTSTAQSGLALPQAGENHAGGFFKPDQAPQRNILQRYGELPLSFEANQGQTDARVKFLSHGLGYTLFLTSGEAVLALRKTSAQKGDSSTAKAPALEANKSAVFHMQLLGSNPASTVSGLDEMPGKSNYFIGNNPKEWRTKVTNYMKVRYQSVYPGVDLVYYGKERQLEYDFLVAPGADPSRIRLKFRGAGTLRIDDNGDLVLGADREQVRLQKPQVYQETSGTRKAVEGRYWMAEANNTISFRVADYDHSKPLIIDPALIYSTYLGGSSLDDGFGIAVDSSGNAYVTGFTQSANFPSTAGVFQTALGGSTNAFVAKLNPTGTALVYSTYLGGSGSDNGNGIAVDSSGNAYVTGGTNSTNFPTTTGAFQTTTGGGGDAFLTKLNPAGSALVYSTYLGGSGGDGGNGIAVDSSGNTYITGTTNSTNFPTTTGAFQTTSGGGAKAFVTKLNPTSSTPLVYSTYLGGSNGNNSGNGIAVDSSGNAYVTGVTSATNFPTTSGAFQTVLATTYPYTNAFVTKLNPTGSAPLVYSTYLGGSGLGGNGPGDGGMGIAVDSSGNAYVTGFAQSNNFPTTTGAFQTTFGGVQNAFVTKLNPTGSTPLVYSTYLGGSGSDFANSIAVDSSSNAYVTGLTSSTNFPTVNPLPAPNNALQGSSDAFVSKLNPTGSTLVYSIYLGGSGGDDGIGIAVDSSGNVYVTGYTFGDFPTTAGAYQTIYGGSADAFVAKIVEAPGELITNLTTTVDSFNLQQGIADSLDAKLQAAQASLAANNTAACNQMNAFINEAMAQSGKKLTVDQATQLIAAANQIMVALGCGKFHSGV